MSFVPIFLFLLANSDRNTLIWCCYSAIG